MNDIQVPGAELRTAVREYSMYSGLRGGLVLVAGAAMLGAALAVAAVLALLPGGIGAAPTWLRLVPLGVFSAWLIVKGSLRSRIYQRYGHVAPLPSTYMRKVERGMFAVSGVLAGVLIVAIWCRPSPGWEGVVATVVLAAAPVFWQLSGRHASEWGAGMAMSHVGALTLAGMPHVSLPAGIALIGLTYFGLREHRAFRDVERKLAAT